MTEIPQQLRVAAFRFAIMTKGTKSGHEKDWTTTANYAFDDAKLQSALDADSNYGVMCGIGGIVVIDADTKELADAVVEKGLGDTFTVRSGSGGHHFYYLCDTAMTTIPLERDGVHRGDLKCNGCVVGPGSLHPNGERYKVENDAPIMHVDAERIYAAIDGYIRQKSLSDEEIAKRMERDEKRKDTLRIADVVRLEGLRKIGDCEYQGAHPVHGSTTGANFTVNTEMNVWHCFRHNSGGGPLSYIAVAEGLMGCENAVPGYGDKELWRKVYGAARQKYGYAPNYGSERPMILLPGTGRTIGEFAEDVAKYYGGREELFYRPDMHEVERVSMVKVDDDGHEVLGLVPVDGEALVTFLDRDLQLVAMGADDETRAKSLPAGTARVLLKSVDQFLTKLPIMKRLLTVPLPKLNGGRLEFPRRGYDPKFMSFLPFDAPTITEMSLDDAKMLLDSVYAEFAFKGAQDKVNALAHLLTPLCRGLYSRETIRTPIFIYLANRERAGKDYCAGIVGITYQGEAIEDPPVSKGHAQTDDEFRKKLIGVLSSGRRILHSSNNKGHLNSAELEALATKEVYSDRQLGSNVSLEFPNVLELSLSANIGLSYTPDLAQRSIFVNLFLDIEDPNARTFHNPDLHGWAKAHRSDILSALYTLIRHWVEAGCPRCSKPFASFPEWMAVVGGILECAGIGVPQQNDVINAVGGDIETNDMRQLYAFMAERWSGKWINKGDIISEITDPNSPIFGIFAYMGWQKDESRAKHRFAILLGKYAGRIMDGIRMEEDKPKLHANRAKYRFAAIEPSAQGQQQAQKNEKDETQQNAQIGGKEGIDNGRLVGYGKLFILPSERKLENKEYSGSIKNQPIPTNLPPQSQSSNNLLENQSARCDLSYNQKNELLGAPATGADLPHVEPSSVEPSPVADIPTKPTTQPQPQSLTPAADAYHANTFSNSSSLPVLFCPACLQPAFRKHHPGRLDCTADFFTYVYSRFSCGQRCRAHCSAASINVDDNSDPSFRNMVQLMPACPSRRYSGLQRNHTNSALPSGDSSTSFSPGPTKPSFAPMCLRE